MYQKLDKIAEISANINSIADLLELLSEGFFSKGDQQESNAIYAITQALRAQQQELDSSIEESLKLNKTLKEVI